MNKCFILILGIFVSFRAQAQFAPTIHSQNNRNLGIAVTTQIKGQSKDGLYKLERDKVVDTQNRNQIVQGARKLDSFIGQKELPKFLSWGAKNEKARYEVNQKVKFTCRVPWKLQRRGEGKIEAIRGIGAKHYAKIEGCDYLVESSLIAVVEEKSPQKQQVKSRAVAQRSAQ